MLQVAVQLADAEGLPSLTMRRLAADLEVEAMSLYHHVRGKEALLDGVVEMVLTEVDEELPSRHASSPQPAPEGEHEPRGWRSAVASRCLTARQVMLRHPWAPQLIGSRPTTPPAVYRHFDAVLAAMVSDGVSYRLGHQALHSLGTMVLGFSPELFTPGTQQTPDDPEQAQLTQLATETPHLMAMLASESHSSHEPSLGWCDSQREFEFTLGLLLDGLERAAAADDVP
ncbi:TetR/AcrR family transcriptional regulator [Nesterenkonia sp. K-15-9-6]|uniref:TetR/AcrR family transcriptional regulator n=1 Tax=Nesterenkonia sp. K-15-9-6 TaxID=3093918 RepID=UPI004043C7AF